MAYNFYRRTPKAEDLIPCKLVIKTNIPRGATHYAIVDDVIIWAMEIKPARPFFEKEYCVKSSSTSDFHILNENNIGHLNEKLKLLNRNIFQHLSLPLPMPETS